MPTSGGRVLISGASVAGPVLAYWLSRFGFQPTVVEKTAELRLGSGGHAVDLFGPALEIIEWMGALAQVQDARTHTEIISFRAGHRPIDVPAELGRRACLSGTLKSCGRTCQDHLRASRDDSEYSSATRSARLSRPSTASMSSSSTDRREHLILSWGRRTAFDHSAAGTVMSTGS